MNQTIFHNFAQGSQPWLQFRLTKFGASEAAAMLGLSKKVTRTELLHMKHTGTPKEFSDWVQKNILDYGHEVEALARPIIEETVLHAELYPVTCSLGNLSASCDGLTMDNPVALEHKQWNEQLAASVRAGILPEEHMPQCQQVMMVNGAEKVLFVVSDGTADKMVHMEVLPDEEWFDRIRAGWEQFEKDLAEYVPVIHAEKPEAEAVMQLPALSIQTSGSISIISNLEVFGKKLNEFVEKLDLEPTDDQGFVNAEAAVKTLQKAQDALEAAEASALAQASDVDEMRRTVALYADTARKTRLMLEKMVVARKKQIKDEIITKARNAYAAHIQSLEAEIKPTRLVTQQPNLIEAAKNKRTLKSLHDGVDTEIANAKIAADAIAKDIRTKLAWHKENSVGYEFLFADMQQIVYKPADDFQMLVKNRIDQHKADEAKKLEVERERIQAEEKRKVEEKVRTEQKPAEVAPVIPVPNTAKPSLVRTQSKPGISPALMNLARVDLEFYRKKYAEIPELAAVMREIDSFLTATAPQVTRKTVEAV